MHFMYCLITQTNKQTDRPVDRPIGQLTNRQTERTNLIDGQIYRWSNQPTSQPTDWQTDWQINRHTDRQGNICYDLKFTFTCIYNYSQPWPKLWVKASDWLSKQVERTQLTFTCSNSTIEHYKKVWNMFKVNNKNTRMTSQS